MHRHLDAARRRRGRADVLRAVRAAAPRPGGRRHRRQRRPAGPAPQGARASCRTCSRRHAHAAHRLPLDRPHPLLDDRIVERQRNIQPFLVETMHGPLAVAHNGNIVNTPALRDELLTRGFGLTATSDTEVIDADARRCRRHAPGRSASSARCRRGRAPSRSSCSPPTTSSPSATRGASGRCRSVASPTAATPWPARRARCRRSAASRSTRSSPGEIVTLRGAELHRHQALAPAATQARCTFEFVYFSRPDSVWDGHNVHHVRQRLGVELAARVGRRRRRRDPGARLLDPGRDRVLAGERRSRTTTG